MIRMRPSREVCWLTVILRGGFQACKNMDSPEKIEIFDYFTHFSPIKLKYQKEFSQDEFYSK